ncbi:MAG: ATP-dependent DNA helicase, partial [Methanomicrobiales archaeon]|nr:ATP-dependent DNA helicase [Methanomicrobiales archaeon]
GELLNGAMVIGLPLAPYNRVRMMIIEYFRRKYGEEGEFISYTLPAINRVLQALGRVIRTPEERGILILGERRFFESKIRDALPVWYQEEMLTCDVTTFDRFLEGWR